MVKGQLGEVVPRKEPDLSRIVTGHGDAVRSGQKDRGGRMLPGITVRIRLGMKLTQTGHVKAGLFPGLPHRRRLKRLSIIDKSTGQRPAEGRVLPFDQHDPAFNLDDDINSRGRVAMYSDRCPAVRAFHLLPFLHSRHLSLSGCGA